MPDPHDPPEYDWLYGQGRSGHPVEPGPDDPEPTRVLPRAVPPPGGTTATPPSPTPTTPPARPRRRRTRLIGRILLLLLVAWLAALIAIPVLAWQRIEKVDASPDGDRPADQPGMNFLLVGSDSRKGLTKAENRRLGTGGVGDIGQRTDTIMVLHVGSGPSLLLSIPRDSLVPVPGHGTTKINAAFAYGGPQLLVETIEQSTGLYLDRYVEIGFGGFVNAVDAVGGVEICPEKKMVDKRANLRIKKGCQEVDGVTALAYSRSRHTSALGDIDRARHQREVVAAIGAEVKSPWTVLNPFRLRKVADAGTSSLVVGENTGPIDLAKFAWAMTKVNGTDGLTCSMPIRDLAVHWDEKRADRLVGFLKTDDTGDIPKKLCRPTGLAP